MALMFKSVELATGVTLPCVEQGDALGVPVVLLHGFGGSWRSFAPLLPRLPAALHVFAPTQRGHAEASKPAEGYRLPDFAEDVVALMDAVDLESAVVVGHAMGAAVAQVMALDHPDRVAGLVLAGACVIRPRAAQVRTFWDTTVAGLEDPVDPKVVQAFLERRLARAVPPELFEQMLDDALQVPARVWQAVWRARLEADDLSREVQDIEATTLLVWGDRDTWCPQRDQETLMDAITTVELLIYGGVGHEIPAEAPERFADDIVGFIGEDVGP